MLTGLKSLKSRTVNTFRKLSHRYARFCFFDVVGLPRSARAFIASNKVSSFVSWIFSFTMPTFAVCGVQSLLFLLAWGCCVCRPTVAALTTLTPNIVIILVDDLGMSGIESNNPFIKGPAVTELREDGLYMQRHYVYKFCSPTRGSLLSSRYPFRL